MGLTTELREVQKRTEAKGLKNTIQGLQAYLNYYLTSKRYFVN
jgi:hypothetical protein